MLSRVAANLYWFGRYIERAEDSARLIRVNTQLLLDLPVGISPGWRPLVEITGGMQDFEAKYDEATERNVLKFLIADQSNHSSILNSLAYARENIRTVRDIVPREVWEQVNELHMYAKDHVQTGLGKRGRHDYLETIVERAQGIAGTLGGTMNHDAGFVFMRSGRHLERADMTSRIIDVRSASLLPSETSDIKSFDNIQWMSVLKSLTAYQMYRRSVQTRVERTGVLSFLLKNSTFPRAVAYNLDAIRDGIQVLGDASPVLLVLSRCRRLVDQADTAKLSQEELHEFIDQLQVSLADLNTAIVAAFFSPQASQSQSQSQA